MQLHSWKLLRKLNQLVCIIYYPSSVLLTVGYTVYLGTFIMQCFNVYAVKARFSVRACFYDSPMR